MWGLVNFVVLSVIYFRLSDGSLTWENIDELEDVLTIAEIIGKSDRLVKIGGSTPDYFVTTDENSRPKITPKLQCIIDNDIGTRLVISKYENDGFSSNFFSAINVKEKLVHRLGKIMKRIDDIILEVSESGAVKHAEVYYRWAPFLFQENWKIIATEEANLCQTFQNFDKTFQINWLWLVDQENMVGIYRQQNSGMNSENYLYVLGRKLNTTEATVVEISQPMELAEVECKIAQSLTKLFPFLDTRWFSLKKFTTEYKDEGKEMLERLTTAAAIQRKVHPKFINWQDLFTRGDMLFGMFTAIGTCDQSAYNLAGLKGMSMTLAVYIDMGDNVPTFNTMFETIQNYFEFAYRPSLLPETDGWTWPWQHINRVDEGRIPLDSFDRIVKSKAPFSVGRLDKIFVQKILIRDNGQKMEGAVVYAYKSKFFVAIFTYDAIMKWQLLHVDTLKFWKDLKSKAFGLIEAIQKAKLNLPEGVKNAAAKITSKLEAEIPDLAAAWQDYFLKAESTVDWLVDQGYVPTPTPARNVESTVNWFRLICKVPQKQGTDAPNSETYTYFNVLMINDGLDLLIPESGGDCTAETIQDVNIIFQRFLRHEHDIEIANSQLR